MIVHGDFETRSTVDLKECGLDIYAKHSSTDIWCFAWAIGDSEPEVWCPGNPIPEFMRPSTFKTVVFIAHNANFELAIWNRIATIRYGWPRLIPEQVRCTMAMAYAMALPGSLENAAAALGLEQQKDQADRKSVV